MRFHLASKPGFSTELFRFIECVRVCECVREGESLPFSRSLLLEMNYSGLWFVCFLDKLSVETLQGAVFMIDEVFQGILFRRRSVFVLGLSVWC